MVKAPLEKNGVLQRELQHEVTIMEYLHTTSDKVGLYANQLIAVDFYGYTTAAIYRLYPQGSLEELLVNNFDMKMNQRIHRCFALRPKSPFAADVN